MIEENNYKQCFKKIVFAIKASNTKGVCSNYIAFSDTLVGGLFLNWTYASLPEIVFPSRKKICGTTVYLTRLLSSQDNEEGAKSYIRDGLYDENENETIMNLLKQHEEYYKYQSQNKYFGKQFSILGDSISALGGYNPQGYNVFYSGDNCAKSSVNEMKDTWWGKVIDFFGGELLVNNSWSGSRVTKLPNQESLFPSGCSDERTSNLHINSVKPDVIIVYLGTNDWANNVSLYPEDLNHIDIERARISIEMDKFEDAYMAMLSKLYQNYPNAEIWCCTLCETYISKRPDFQFPHKYAGIHIEAYNDSIRKITKDYKCKLIDLYNYHIPYDTIDGTHPNESGMNTIATLVLREMADEQGKDLLDCEKEQHDFVAVEEYTGGTRYICSRCGKTIHKSIFPSVACTDEQHEYEMFDQTGSYDYYKCKKCGKIKQECAWGEMLMNQEKDIVQNVDNNEELKVEYVCASPDITRVLHSDNEIRLFDNNINQNLNIKKDKILVGRESICDLQIKETAISRYHATFYFEDSVWYIADNNSKNGTWLNEKKLEPFKKYELIPGDVIDFTHQKQYVFFKSCDNKKNSNNIDRAETALAVLEDAAIACRKSDFNDINASKLIAIALCQAPLYFPMEIDIDVMFDNIDVQNLKAGDVITPSQDVRMRFLTLNLDGEEVIPLFTSEEQIKKGPSVSTSRFYPQDYLPMLLESKKSIVINPFDENQVSFKYGFISDIVYPIFKGDIRESKEEFDVGSVIDGKYKLLAIVGQGITFKVYLANDVRLNKCWAVKVHDKKSHDSEIIMQMALQEVNMVKKLDHPAIPKIVDIVDNKNYLCIVEEYIEGETLEALVSKMGPQPVELVVELGKQLCNVLGYLHSLNPPHIYRDMKPANIMLKPDGNIKIIDFGIIRLYDAKATADENCLGTLGYASPEHFGGKGQTDARSDIYSLGVTLHRLLTGFNPSKDVPPLICSINPNLPIGLEYIISKCTKSNPAERYQTCEELMADLDRYQELPRKSNIFKKIFEK